jgi:hypothetical protein
MFAKPELQATTRRLFEALRQRFPDRYVTLVVLVVVPLAFGAFFIAVMMPRTHTFAP